jgi:hypothetical protein
MDRLGFGDCQPVVDVARASVEMIRTCGPLGYNRGMDARKIDWKFTLASALFGVACLFFTAQSETDGKWKWPAAAAVILSSLVFLRFGRDLGNGSRN